MPLHERIKTVAQSPKEPSRSPKVDDVPQTRSTWRLCLFAAIMALEQISSMPVLPNSRLHCSWNCFMPPLSTSQLKSSCIYHVATASAPPQYLCLLRLTIAPRIAIFLPKTRSGLFSRSASLLVTGALLVVTGALLVVTGALLVVTGALLVVTRSY